MCLLFGYSIVADIEIQVSVVELTLFVHTGTSLILDLSCNCRRDKVRRFHVASVSHLGKAGSIVDHDCGGFHLERY